MQVNVIIQTIVSDTDEQSFIHSIWENEHNAEEYCKELNYYNNVENLAIKAGDYILIWSEISDEFFKMYEDWSGDEEEIFKGSLAKSIVENKYHLSFEDWVSAYELYTMIESGEYTKFHIEKYDVL